MNFQELAAKIAETHPRIPATVVSQVLRTALKAISAEIEGHEEGALSIPLLGHFRIRNIETEKDGVKSQTRRTLYVAPRLSLASDAGTRAPDDAAGANQA